MPIVNGSTADFVLKGAVGLLAMLVLGVGYLASTGAPIPTEYTALITALLGLIAGSRVVPPDVSARIKEEPVTDQERHIQEDISRAETANTLRQTYQEDRRNER